MLLAGMSRLDHRRVLDLVNTVISGDWAASGGLALGANAYFDMPVFDLLKLIKKLQPPVPMLQQSSTDEEKRRSE